MMVISYKDGEVDEVGEIMRGHFLMG